MRIFVTGDIHGDPMDRFSSSVFPIGKTLTESDIIIICGDFGVVFEDTVQANIRMRHNLKWLDSKPWTTMFIPGNHEGYDLLETFPFVKKFNVQMRQLGEKCFMIPNGTLLNLDNKTFWCMGGAMSTDKAWRKEYELRNKVKIWWDQEIATIKEMQHGVDLLDSINWKVDYVLTHTMPSSCVETFINRTVTRAKYTLRTEDPMARYLEFIKKQKIKYQNWFCGHFHTEECCEGISILYKKIIEL